MPVVFRDALLRRAAEDPTFSPPEWSEEAVKAYRRKLQKLDAVHFVSDLFQIYSIGVRRLSATDGPLAIALDENLVLVLHVEVDPDGSRPRVVLDRIDVRREEKSA